MEAIGVITVIAILLAPLCAVQVQKWTERFRWKQSRKLGIFETLMSTRAARLSAGHVEALNMIDITFSYRRKREKAVIEAWKAYLDNLTTLEDKPSDARLETWIGRNDDLFTELLFEMSKAVGYHFDKTHLKRSIYSPRAHGEDALDERIIRKGLVDVFAGNKAIPIEQIASEEAIKRQSDFQESLLRASTDTDRVFNVRIVRDTEDEDRQKIERSSE